MIYHITTSGTPISWSIAAIYDGMLGIASKAAAAWHEQSGSPQCLIKVEDGKAECLTMHWTEQDRQQPKDHGMFVSGFKDLVDEETRAAIEDAIRGDLIDRAYFIPREEWEVRYPASKLISDRFREFNVACASLDRNAGEDLVFEEKWVMFMKKPKGYVLPYNVVPSGKGYGLAPQRDDVEDPTEGKVWREIEDANAVCRTLNSGWDWEQAQILLAPEPVDAR